MSCDANRFVTWNVNSLKVRLPHVLRYLDEKRPTLVALQELKCVTEQVPTEPFAERGYQILAFGQPTYNGVALIAPNEWQAQEVHRGNFGLWFFCYTVRTAVTAFRHDEFLFRLWPSRRTEDPAARPSASLRLPKLRDDPLRKSAHRRGDVAATGQPDPALSPRDRPTNRLLDASCRIHGV